MLDSTMGNGVVTVATDQLPYPPRNGVTLPVHEFLRVFGSGRVRLLLLHQAGAPLDLEQLAENEARFGKVTVIAYRRVSALRRIFAELLGKEAFCHGWRADAPVEPTDSQDRLYVSPISAVAKWSALGSIKPSGARWVAGINDCMAAEFHFRSRQFVGGSLARVKAWCDRLRAPKIGNIERQLLATFDSVLVQTPRDKELVSVLVGHEIAEKVHVVPNGVDAAYLNTKPNREVGDVVTFVADFGDEYHATAMWLIERVWPQVLESTPHLRLQLIGRNARPRLLRAVELAVGVSYTSYVSDLAEQYAQTTIALSPVFKGFGLINKTVEAMAAGLPVVGGTGAFNGITNFEAGRHGLMVERQGDADAFARAIVQLALQPSLRQEIGDAARDLVSFNFNWEASGRVVEGLLG